MSLFEKLVPKNIAGIIGVIQAILTFVREMCILTIRVFGFWIPDDPYEMIINKVAEVANKLHGYLETAKNYLL